MYYKGRGLTPIIFRISFQDTIQLSFRNGKKEFIHHCERNKPKARHKRTQLFVDRDELLENFRNGTDFERKSNKYVFVQ